MSPTTELTAELPVSKMSVRLNAVKHGLYSQTLIVPAEDQAAFAADQEQLQAHYRPQTFEERELVQTLCLSRWRLCHISTMEHNLQRLTEEQQLPTIDELFGEQDELTRRALAQAAGRQANARLFDQLSRQEARIQRTIERTRRELAFHMSQRLQAAPEPELMKQSQPALPGTPAQMPHFTGSLAEFKRKQWIRQQARLNSPSAAPLNPQPAPKR